ncbi:MAG TPA: hypothetical protein PLP21_08770 [Pyrinomonadaceae bacterium]|nr:hypothetical protein [Acidobacteriota bacterium]HQZ96398.1 hypothetical protein [Pyrinomonadaceae bacterium]
MKNVVLLLISIVVIANSVSGQKLSAEEIIAKNVASIGSPEKLASVKSLLAVGEVKVDFVTQKNLPASGRILVGSEGKKSFFGIQTNATDYPQEKVIFDGSKTDVAMVRGGSRSILGNFIQSNTSLVSQGFLSGTLSTSWHLLSAADRGAKISTAGTKKINGKEAYVLEISPKGGSDLDITMYFDQKTFQHIRTEYRRTSSSSIGRTIDESARQSENKIKVTEDFSEFQDYEGLMLPRKYRLQYSTSGTTTTEIVWNGNFTEFAINKLDPSTFKITP